MIIRLDFYRVFVRILSEIKTPSIDLEQCPMKPTLQPLLSPSQWIFFLLNPTPPEPEPHPPITVMYTKSTLLSVRCDQMMSDVSIAQPIEDVKLGETSFNAKLYTNELDIPLSL